MAKFVMMIGLPGSGKSYKAKELSEKLNATIFSSDTYRAIYGSGEEDQSKNGLVFQKLREDIMKELNAGNNVILDATNITLKSRRSWLNSVPKGTFKQAYLVLAKYETCIEQNNTRERKVPKYVIDRMYKQFDVPSFEEGFDEISTYYKDEKTFNIEKFFEDHGNDNQDNKHHTLSLGDHMKKAYAMFCVSYTNARNELKYAAELHDIGKPFCKVFKDSKGNKTEEAHYFGHEHVGAYDVLFLDMPLDVLKISWIINHHMDPFNWNNENAKKNWIRKWGKENYDIIKRIHLADVMAK